MSKKGAINKKSNKTNNQPETVTIRLVGFGNESPRYNGRIIVATEQNVTVDPTTGTFTFTAIDNRLITPVGTQYEITFN